MPKLKPLTPEQQAVQDELKGRLERLAMLGMRNKDIAIAENLKLSTMTRKYKTELMRGRAKGKGTVMQTAFKMAVSGNYPTMTIFFLKTRCGWREKDRPKFEEDSQKPLTHSVPPDKLPDDPIEAAKIYQKYISGI